MQEETLSWGEIIPEDIYRKLYKNKVLEQMSEEEINQMLEDLI